MLLTNRLNGGHAEINWNCPDWKSYTLDHPRLQKHVERLAKKGLKDPWIRNYAWHYSPKIYNTPLQLLKNVYLARAPHGLALAILITIGFKGYEHWKKNKPHIEN